MGEGDPVRVREMADEHAEARFVDGRGRAAGRRGRQPRGDRGLLPHQRAVAGARGHAGAGRRSATRSSAARSSTSARRSRTRSTTSRSWSTRRTGRRSRGSPTRRGAGSGRRRCRACSRTPTTMGHDASGRPRDADDVPGLGDGGAQGARALHVDDAPPARSASRAARRSEQLLQRAARGDGLHGGAARPSGRSRRRAGIENLEELVRGRARVRRQQRRGRPNVGEFLQQIALLADADTIRDDEGLVTLMTLHNAKGLEFPIVFIIGMEDGTFPHSRSIEEGNIEEERRLAYVGLTRAMRDLTLTYARRRNAFGGASAARRSAVALPRRDPARADRPAERAGRPASRRRAAVASWAGAARPPRRRRRSRRRVPRRRGRRPRRSSATASSPASSRAGSSSCASPATAASAS